MNDQLAKGQATETKPGAATPAGGSSKPKPEQQPDERGDTPATVNGHPLGEEGSEAEEVEVQRHT